jgi:hypothetical protein
MGVKLESLTLRKEHQLRVLENRVLRGIFGSKRINWQEVGENSTMSRFITYTLCQK